jgi:NADH-quinone oxidoreductase subunit M
MGTYITFPELLLWIPIIFACVVFFNKDEKAVKAWALTSSLLTLAISVISLYYADNSRYFLYNNVSYVWMPYIGSSFAVGLDGMGHMLTFLTAISFPLIFAATYNTNIRSLVSFMG